MLSPLAPLTVADHEARTAFNESIDAAAAAATCCTAHIGTAAIATSAAARHELLDDDVLLREHLTSQVSLLLHVHLQGLLSQLQVSFILAQCIALACELCYLV